MHHLDAKAWLCNSRNSRHDKANRQDGVPENRVLS